MNSKRMRNEERDIYANNLPVVQSPGTGKSRMVDEMAKLIFTIPFSIRSPYADDDIRYPQADQEVVDFLLRKIGGYWEDVLLLYLVFFEHLFVRVEEVLEQQFSSDRYADESHLARAWREYLTTERAGLYKSVIERIDQRGKVPNPTDDDIKRQARDTVAKGASLIKQLEKLTRRETQDGSDGKDQTSLRLVIYFDDAHRLMWYHVRARTYERHNSLYRALRCVLNHMRKLPLFAVTLSTVCNLIEPAPRGVLVWEYDTLQAPYTELPFDCLIDGKPFMEAGQCTLEDTCQLCFLSQFGRPLWHTLYKNAHDAVRSNLIEFATDKLTGIRDYNDTEDSPDALARARLAILSTRLLLDMSATQAAVKMEARMVEANMRVAYSVPAHRKYLRSGYPSEPILAEAATRAMAVLRQPAATILASFVESGLVERGSRGELAARLLLIRAFDAAATKNRSGGTSPIPSRPVPLLDFLEALLGAGRLEEIRKAAPDNAVSSTTTFEEAFQDARVHFTHFVRNRDAGVASSFGAWAALARGMAMQCAPSEDGVDCVVPVLLRSGDKLCEGAVTGLLIRCTNERRGSPVTIAEEAMNGGKGFFPRNKNDARPYIALVMQLGCQPGDESDVCASPREDSPCEAEKSARHPRYSIDIRGCSPAEYPIIEQEAASSYAALLGDQDLSSGHARRDLFSEHARQNPVSLEAVRRLKPTWTTKGDGGYDWLKDPEFEELFKLEE
ncbi:hypothetical protein WOLCODRAFT_137608 [Wolfiporia cocos MD-104 SS10]|uniref:Uncharacterized protein n=1 Tax=Wolfiporia cocos (strain MD-104) TaxID=742152 RepID=A0A2H3JI63_WOLCO|nr:hypothetical protein WOLCODRAFT_137608 [Wolfiporia cocos MD-104 SS10]